MEKALMWTVIMAAECECVCMSAAQYTHGDIYERRLY